MSGQIAHSTRYLAGRQSESEGKLSEAESHYRSIQLSDPSYLAALHRLGALAARAGRIDEARTFYARALELNPNSPEALECLAAFARQDGLLAQAVVYYLQGTKVEPQNLRIWFGLADCYLEMWHIETAIQGFRRVIALSPILAPAYDRLGVALWRQGQINEAIQSFETAIKLAPSMPASYANLGQLHLKAGRSDQAADVFSEAEKVAGDAFDRLLDLANAYLNLGLFEPAESILRKALRVNPEDGTAAHMLAKLLQITGRYTEAEAALMTLISTHPEVAAAYSDVIRGRRMTFEDAEFLRQVESVANSPHTKTSARQKLEYALGKASDDLGDYAKALEHFSRANAIAASRVPAGLNDATRLKANNDRVISTFSHDEIEKLRVYGTTSTLPIFVVGMIRSGTTLIEQILSSHPSTGAAGELSFLKDQARTVLLPSLEENREKLGQLAEDYLRRLRFEAPGKLRVTDKMPANLPLIGLIAILFPKAKVIFCERDHYDLCLSAFVTPHDKPGAFLHSAENIAQQFREHERLSNHWRSVLNPDMHITMRYEALVTDTESSVRGLLEFLGLPWDDACLAHHRNERRVQTPSEWQVRQGIYTSSIGRWRNYEPWITELKRYLA